MTTIERPFELPTAADAARLWFLDLIHQPRALPPMCSDMNSELFKNSPIALDGIVVNGYYYSSPKATSGPPPEMPALPPGQALRNWETKYLPETRGVYELWRNADYAAMDAAAVVAFIRATLPATGTALGNTIVSAMELGPDAERLTTFIERRLGLAGDLLSATILHGGGSQTRSLGDEVRTLAESARKTPAAHAALLARDFAAARNVADAPWGSGLTAFLEDHEDEIALWTELQEPAWNEDPVPLMRLVAATLATTDHDRRDGSADAIAEVRLKLAPADIVEFEEALALSRDYVPVIEHRARWQLKLCGGIRRALVALGDRLVAMNVAESADDVFFLHLEELEPAAAGELDVRELARTRRAEWHVNLTLKAPLTLGLPVPYEMLGAMSPMMRRMFGAVAVDAPTQTVVSGIAASGGVARGRARVVRSLAEAEDLLEGDILVCPSTSPPWTPYLAIVAAVVTNAGGVISHAAIEAREYGIPAVVGTRNATDTVPDGAMVTVDGTAGTVTIEV